ncbi:hypothetical protein, partial [Bradyrhizobium brasilense]|uniref:hypothetical protein n=1 Tax=Bradyrhizobium brasilense TaxID=1419277 RepID=UPI001E3EE9B9
PTGLKPPQQPWHDQSGKAVPAFRLPCKSETKATDHELQKHDIFTRYGQLLGATPIAAGSFAWGCFRYFGGSRSRRA